MRIRILIHMEAITDLKQFAKLADGPASFIGYGNVRYTLINHETARRSSQVDEVEAKRFMARFRPSAKVVDNPCKRCGGEGRILTYSYVHNGICLRCNGTGKECAK